jgi:predicted dehydrogenase
MYVDEMKHFVECLAEGRSTTLPIPDAAALMQVVFAAKESSAQGRVVSIGKAAR